MILIDKHYCLTKDIFEENDFNIIEDRLTSKYPQSHKVLYNFQKKIEYLISKIEISTESDYYFTQIITRVVIEHFIVGHYIWTKTRNGQNDNCGVEYYAHYRLSEQLKRENYNLGIEGIEKNIKNYATFENLQKGFSEYPEKVNQIEIDSIHSKGNQFEIKSIFNYLINKIPEDKYFNESNKMISQFLKMYNELSSYIHGGPSAEYETFDSKTEIDKTKIIEEDILYAKLASTILKEHIMMLFCEEKPKYFEIIEPIMNLRRESLSIQNIKYT